MLFNKDKPKMGQNETNCEQNEMQIEIFVPYE